MATKRNKYIMKHGDVIDIEEYHDGNYGAKGIKRTPKKKLTKEDMQKVNDQNKTKKCRQRLLQYFSFGDCFATSAYGMKKQTSYHGGGIEGFSKGNRKGSGTVQEKRAGTFLDPEHRKGNKGRLAYSPGSKRNWRYCQYPAKGMEERRHLVHGNPEKQIL